MENVSVNRSMKKRGKNKSMLREFLSHLMPTYPHSGPSHSLISLAAPQERVGMPPGRFRPRDFEMPCYPLWVHLSWLLFALPLL